MRAIGHITNRFFMSLPQHWQRFLSEQQQQAYYSSLQAKLAERAKLGAIIYPPSEQVFNAFQYVDIEQTKVVILGQDPYHGANQAHGLAFSVNKGVKVPPSLVNIYKELAQDVDDFVVPEHGDLSAWAQQGVLLLNTTLTVEQANANAHAKLGWQQFTDNAIKAVSERNSGCVFILWGSHAQKKTKLIDGDKHCILAGPHPSPLSAYRGFFGCQHFSRANQWLANQGKSVIDWQV